MNVSRLKTGVWLLTACVVALTIFVWWPSASNLTAYSVFPLLGLLAFSLMWVHYVAGAVRRYANIPQDALGSHFKITSGLVLMLIVAHPTMLYIQSYRDGLGLPYQSIPILYPGIIESIAVYAGVMALLIFLTFELYRFFNDRTWWKYVEWTNIAAMLLVLWHGFTLGGELRQPWFQVVWIVYALTFIGAVIYSESHKRRMSVYGTAKAKN